MAIKLPNGKYSCSYCDRVYNTPTEADFCRDNHNLIYIPISKSDLNQLIHFLYMKDDSLLTKSMVKTLTTYLKGNTDD